MAWKKRYSSTDHARNNSGQSKKFGNKKSKAVIEGIEYAFDSAIELRITRELVALKDKGIIKSVQPHPKPIVLYKSTKLANGETLREVYFNVDILITTNDDKLIYLDVKSFATITAEFILKYKMAYHIANTYVRIITAKEWKGEETLLKLIKDNWRNALSKPMLKKLKDVE